MVECHQTQPDLVPLGKTKGSPPLMPWQRSSVTWPPFTPWWRGADPSLAVAEGDPPHAVAEGGRWQPEQWPGLASSSVASFTMAKGPTVMVAPALAVRPIMLWFGYERKETSICPMLTLPRRLPRSSGMTPTSIRFSNIHFKIENTGLIESVGECDDKDDDRSRWSPVGKMLLVGGQFGTPLALFPRSLRGQVMTRRSDAVTSSPRSVCPVFPKEKKREKYWTYWECWRRWRRRWRPFPVVPDCQDAGWGMIWDPLGPVSKVPPGSTDDETSWHCYIIAEVCLSRFP